MTHERNTLSGAGSSAQGKRLPVEERIAELERELAATKRALDGARAEAAEGRFFKKLVEAMTDVISVIGADGRVRWVSPSNERVVGSTASQPAGTHLVDIIHPDDYPRVLKLFTEVLSFPPDRIAKAEYRRQHADGRCVHMETVARNLSDDPDACAASSARGATRERVRSASRAAPRRAGEVRDGDARLAGGPVGARSPN